MSRPSWLSFVLAGLVAGAISVGCTGKQVREEGAGISKAAAPSAEQAVGREAAGAKDAAATAGGDAGRGAASGAVPRSSTPPPASTAALEPASHAPRAGPGLSGETRSGLERIYFEFDQAVLTDESQQTLAKNAAHLKQAPGVRIRIEGHCDERGTAEYNLALGERRALSAYRYLLDLGIPQARMSVTSYGKEAPADVGHNEQAWAQNRRAEFVELRN